MKEQFIFILKVLILSLILSVIIKSTGLLIKINDYKFLTISSIIAILLPSLIMAIILGIKSQSKLKN